MVAASALGTHRLAHAPRTGATTRSAQRPWLFRSAQRPWLFRSAQRPWLFRLDRVRRPRRLHQPGRAGWPGLCRARRRGG